MQPSALILPTLPRQLPQKILAAFSLVFALLLPTAGLALQCQNQACTITGTDRNDELIGTPGNDVICGLDGNDTVFGGGGDDLICGGPGNDRLYGEDGHDNLLGGAGRDHLSGGPQDDVLDGSQGNDLLEGGDGSDFLSGGEGKDSLDGGPGEDLCDTDRRDDSIRCSALSFETASTGRFTTIGNRIFTPTGEEFVPRGVNIFPWHRSPATVDAIQDCWQFNLVRLHAWILPNATSQWKDHVVYLEEPLLFDPATVELTTYDVAALIDYYTSRRIVVVFDVHENIGRYIEGDELSDYLRFVTDLITRYKNNPYLWLDVHNEPGSLEGQSSDFSRWRTEMSTILDTVKAISPDTMTLVSGTAWGQDTGPAWDSAPVDSNQSALLSNADIITRYRNVLPTFHVYDQWTFGQDRLQDFVARLFAVTSRPVVIGEYGSINNVSTISASQALHWLTGEPGFSSLGRVVWTWDAYDGNDLTTNANGGGQHVDSCSTPGNLTPLGQLVWTDNH